jgi:hypothetical protein
MHLKSYLTKNFKNLSLNSPLFYNWDYGIRFNIGYLDLWLNDDGRKVLNFEYAKQGLARVKTLFEYLFDANDEVIVVCQQYSDGRQKIKKQSFCFRNVSQYSELESYKIENPYFDKDNEYTKKEHWHRVVLHCKVEDINQQEFFKHSLEYDFRYRNDIEVYFINKNKNIIFHNYDDRGLDVVAKEPKSLKKLYEKYNNWILDYDRLKIDIIFNNGG